MLINANNYNLNWRSRKTTHYILCPFIRYCDDAKIPVKYLLIGIDINNLNLFKIIEIGKNGTNTTLKIKNQSYNISLPENHFNFDTEFNKGYLI